jgi:Fe2+ transport system protein B
MLPPMAIFFPCFTLLEDMGYLPRIAFNLDRFFKKAGAHGKQSLTMSMGFGCNAAGVAACRIIESPRERLIAMLTNNFVPCNGRFPTLIALAGLMALGMGSSAGATLIVVGVVMTGIAVTLAVSWLLSKSPDLHVFQDDQADHQRRGDDSPVDLCKSKTDRRRYPFYKPKLSIRQGLERKPCPLFLQ